MFRQQVQSDFKRQFLDLTVDKLLEQFVLNKYTGLEKPGKRFCDFFKICVQFPFENLWAVIYFNSTHKWPASRLLLIQNN